MNSGLYSSLVGADLLIPHIEVSIHPENEPLAYKICQPEIIPFISYPYEWCFSHLRDAALTTLKIQQIALKFGMSLKDSSAFNIQFRKGKPIFIDTLSFERYDGAQPWIAYRQFCQHFLAPLSLMSQRDIRLNQLSRIYIDGIPLDLASSLLPFQSYLRFGLLSHIHIHAKFQRHFANKAITINKFKISCESLIGLIENLESVVYRLRYKTHATEWADYYKSNNTYSLDAFNHKLTIVGQFLDRVNPKNVWDIGANVGIFSRIASDKGIQTISLDIDPVAVEKNYRECVKRGESNILPLLIDLTNPSPSVGWGSRERMSLVGRGPADTIFALALIHHLAISNNLPFKKIAEFLSHMCNSLIIEFVPEDDIQLRQFKASVKSPPNYTESSFVNEFRKYFDIQGIENINDSQRTIYLMKSRHICA